MDDCDAEGRPDPPGNAAAAGRVLQAVRGGAKGVRYAASMKKLAIGCAIVFLVAGAAVVGVGYYGYMKVRSTVTALAELGQARDIERGVRVQTPFVIPESGELTAAQVDKL